MKNLKSLALCFSLVALSLNGLAAGKVNLTMQTQTLWTGLLCKMGLNFL